MSPSPMLTTVAGVFFAMADKGANKRGKNRRVLKNKFFKGGFRNIFCITANTLRATSTETDVNAATSLMRSP